MEANYVLIKEGLTVDPKVKVLKADEYAEFVEASQLLFKARQEASRIKAEAVEIYESEKQRGYQEGIQEGKMMMSEQMIDNVSRTISYFESVENQVSSIVMTSLQKIIGNMETNELMLGVVRNALAVVRNQKRVTVRVAPEQSEAIRSRVDEILTGFPGIGFLDIVSDTRLSATDCILESDIGTVDAGVQTQLEAIQNSLTKCFKKSGR